MMLDNFVEERFTSTVRMFGATGSATVCLDIGRCTDSPVARAVAPPPDAPRIAQDRFDDLIEVVGPTGRAEFLACLIKDMRETADTLDQAMARRDSEAAHRCCHALIGLAGTVGALGLHDLASDLDQVLRDGRQNKARHLLPEILAEVDRLIGFYRRIAAPEEIA